MRENSDTAITSRVDDLYRKAIENDVKDYAIFLTDTESRIINWNRGAERILGYREGEVLGESAFIIFTPEDRATKVPQREVETAVATGRAEDERWHLRHDNTRFWASGILTPVRDESGALLGFIKVMRDMTERRRIEQERDRFFTLSMDLLCIVNLDGYFLRTNPTFEKVLGYFEDELRDRCIFDFLHPDDRERGMAEYEKLSTGKPTKSLENRFRCKNGGYKWIAWSYYPVPEEWIGYGVGRDVTDLKRITEALKSHAADLEQANRVKDDFLATLSHELRTPLTSILGWSRLLRSGKLDKVDHDRAIEIVERNAEAQSKLIEDLLDVSRIISGKLRIEFQPVQFAEIVREGVDEFRPAAEAKGISMTADIDETAAPIVGDSNRLKQIVANLLSNAIKFTNEGGQIDVSLHRMDAHARLRVRDNGVGIDPAVLPDIFERFKQADSSNIRVHSGLGLGLAIVHHLVQEHSGTVTAESAGQARGATFTVDFPLVPSEGAIHRGSRTHLFSAGTWKNREHGSELEGITVLLVEDEADTRDLVSTMLREFGARVVAVNSAKEALASIQQVVPSVLVSDIAMSGENGYDLMKQVRALAPAKGGAVPAVALTAYASTSDRRRALIAGFQVHLTKPIKPDELLAVIAGLARSGSAA